MSVLDSLKDYRVVRTTLPLQGGRQKQLDGVARVTEGSLFEVAFLPDQLDHLALDPETTCRIALDVSGEHKSITARILDRPTPEKLLLEQVESFSYQQKREYFRVNADLSVSYWLIDSDNPVAASVAATVNISGGGIRFPVVEPLKEGTRLGLEILIEEPASRVIECTGDVVAGYNQGGEMLAALKFDALEPEDQDAIVSFCLAEQRKQLRLKVQVLGPPGS